MTETHLTSCSFYFYSKRKLHKWLQQVPEPLRLHQL